MMHLSYLLYEDTALTRAEQEWLAEVLQHSTMKKYLRILARNDILELATLSEVEPAVLSRKYDTVKGKLTTLCTLLSAFQ